MWKRIKSGEFLICIFIICALVFIYRDVFLQGNVVFSTHFLASFYSPWTTHKYEGYPNGIPNKPIGGNDNVRMFYPYRTFINEALARGEIPLWNPYNFSGGPLLANFQSAVFYPLNWIYFFLPQITSWDMLVVIQPLLGTLFMYLYLRQFIRQKLAAFFGAFTFGFSGFILVWSQENAVVGQAAIWFPLTLLATDKLISSSSRKNLVFLTTTLTLCILAGFLQVTFYIFLVTFVYGIFRLMQRSQNRSYCFLQLIGAYILSFCLSAVQTLPSVEAFFESARSTSTIEYILEGYLLPLQYYLRVLASDIFGNPATYNYFGRGFYHESIFYIGTIPLVFAVLSLLKLSTNLVVKFFLWVSAITFVFGVKSFFTDWFYRLPILLINTFTPSRIFFLTSAGISVVSAFGFAHWLEKDIKSTRRILYVASSIIAVILITVAGYYYLSAITKNNTSLLVFISSKINPHFYLNRENAITSFRNIILPVTMVLSVIIMIRLRRKLHYFAILVLLMACVGQFYFLNKYAVIGKKEFLYPDHFIFDDILSHQGKADRFVSFGLPIVGNVGLEKHVFSPDGIDPVFPRRYGELVYAAKNRGMYKKDIPRIEVSLSEYSDNYKDLLDSRVFKLMSLLGVTRVYNYEKEYDDTDILITLFPPSVFIPLWEREGWRAYENSRSLPRVFLTEDYVVEKNSQKILDIIFDPQTDLRKTVILEEKPQNVSTVQADHADKTENNVSLEVYKPQYVKLDVSTDAERMLFLSDTFYPGWTATIDDSFTKIYRANYAFRAVVVPKGRHTVEFLFKPWTFTVGSVISATTLLLLILILGRYKNLSRDRRLR